MYIQDILEIWSAVCVSEIFWVDQKTGVRLNLIVLQDKLLAFVKYYNAYKVNQSGSDVLVMHICIV